MIAYLARFCIDINRRFGEHFRIDGLVKQQAQAHAELYRF